MSALSPGLVDPRIAIDQAADSAEQAFRRCGSAAAVLEVQRALAQDLAEVFGRDLEDAAVAGIVLLNGRLGVATLPADQAESDGELTAADGASLTLCLGINLLHALHAGAATA